MTRSRPRRRLAVLRSDALPRRANGGAFFWAYEINFLAEPIKPLSLFLPAEVTNSHLLGSSIPPQGQMPGQWEPSPFVRATAGAFF